MEILEIHDGHLRPATRPTPQPGPGEVLVQVAAAGVNRADLLQVAGQYPPPPGEPDYPGLEVAGRVIAVGPPAPSTPAPTGRERPAEPKEAHSTPEDILGEGGQREWATPAVGDRVAALLAGGGYASHAVVPAAQTMPVPDTLSDAEAAALPEALATVWSNLVGVGDRPVGDLKRGETLLVIGGSGGVGSTAIQIGRLLGARVIATAGGAERVAAVEALGADHVLDHRALDPAALTDAVKELGGADVILDVLGGPALAQNVRRLRTGGRLVVIGTQAGRAGEVDALALMKRRASIHGTTLRARPAAEKAAIMRDVVAHLSGHLASGALRPAVHATVPLAKAARAHEMLRDGVALGKVVLLP